MEVYPQEAGMRRAESEAFVHGEWPVTLSLGMMLIGLGVFSVIFHYTRQSNIIACIIIGAIVGGFDWQSSAWHLRREAADSFIELGIIFLLFLGGLEVDVAAIKAQYKLVLINGLGQIIITLALFCVIGFASGLTTNVETEAPVFVVTFFFGLACTLSSTILVLGCLKKRGEMERPHGQIILGLMVFQDVCAVVGLSVLAAFDLSNPDKQVDIGASIGKIFGIMAALTVILIILNKYVLTRMFDFFAATPELLFIGTLAYALGVSAICSFVGFSAEIGAFFSGVSIASLTYRLQIEQQAEPLKVFGIILFFFMLGIDLELSGEALARAAPMAVLIALLTVFVFPMIMWMLGTISGLDGRTCFLIGQIINQVSEFSLIMAKLANQYKVFDDNLFMIITLATLITLLLSSIGHDLADTIWNKFGWLLAFIDRRATFKEEEKDHFHLHDHVVLLGFNEAALEIAEYYRTEHSKDVMVMNLDAALHSTLKEAYTNAKIVKKQKAGPVLDPKTGEPMEPVVIPEDAPGIGTNIYSVYADPENPESWEHYEVHHASMVVACYIGEAFENIESKVILAKDLASHGVPFIAITDSDVDAHELYQAGCRYVIQQEALAAHVVQGMLTKSAASDMMSFFRKEAELHKKDIAKEQENPTHSALAEYL